MLPSTYEALVNLGAASFEKGDTASAMMAWQGAAAMEPLAGDVFFDMGYASFRKGDFDDAVKNLTASLKNHGRDSEALFLLGRSYERVGRFEESQKAISQATRLSQRVERWMSRPLPDLVRLAMSLPSRTHGQTWTPQRLTRRADGENLSQWLESIQTEIDFYLFGDALRDLQDVIRIFPESTEAHSLLDEVHRRQNVR
jgi:tetratricopeptide (TPR) repeat protein